MARSHVAHQNVDIVLKIIAEALGGALFARFGLALAPIVAALPTELPRVEVYTQRLDLLFRLADGSILHLEFQTERRAETLLRFATYNLAVAAHYGVPVYTVVLYGAGIRSAPGTLRLGSLTFAVQNILVGREDGDATLRRLHEKAARGEPFTPADRIDLMLSPLMRHRRPLNAVLPDAVELSSHLPEEQQGPTAAALVGLMYHYVDEAVVKALLEDLSMANPLQTLIAEREAEAEARGEARGERLALRKVLRARFGPLPEPVERRIDGADARELESLLDAAALVETLDEL